MSIFKHSAAGLAAPVSAGAVELPVRKAGLWEMKVQNAGAPKPEMTMQQCTDETTDTMAEFENRFRNSARTVLSSPQVSGDRPKDRQPSHAGEKSTQGSMWPFITSGAILKLVVSVQ